MMGFEKKSIDGYFDKILEDFGFNIFNYFSFFVQ